MKNDKKILMALAGVALVIALVFTFKPDKSIIYEYDGQKVNADAYFEDMKAYYGAPFILQYLEKIYFSNIEVSKEIESSLELQENQLLEDNSTEEGQKMIDVSLKSFGYSGLDELGLYLKNSFLKNNLISDTLYDYFKDTTSFESNNKPRIVTHILVHSKRESAEHISASSPTNEEQEMMDSIDVALKNSTDIKIDMIKLSSGEDIVGQSLGYLDKNSQMVEPFLSKALTMDALELSEWIKTEFGYHRIYIESTDIENMKSLTAFKEAILEANPKLATTIVLDEMKSNGVELSETFEKELLEMGDN